MILTVTPNPALDVTYTLDHLVPRSTHRVRDVSERAGGKGVNVARVLRRRGHHAHVLGTAGGTDGALIRTGLSEAALEHELVEIEGDSRRTVTLVSAEDGGATLLNEPGPRLSDHEWAELHTLVVNRLSQAAVLVLAGSLPRGVPQDGYARFIETATAHGVPTILDTSGTALRHGVAAGPSIVKPNLEELHELTGCADPAEGAAALREQGARSVVVSLGAQGLLAVTDTPSWQVAPTEEVRGNPTGAGDAVVAALAAGLSSGTPWPEPLRDAAALSAAAVVAPLAGDFDANHYQHARPSLWRRTEDNHAPRLDG